MGWRESPLYEERVLVFVEKMISPSTSPDHDRTDLPGARPFIPLDKLEYGPEIDLFSRHRDSSPKLPIQKYRPRQLSVNSSSFRISPTNCDERCSQPSFLMWS